MPEVFCVVVPDLRIIGLLFAVIALLWRLSQRYDPQKRSGRIIAQVLAGFLLLTVWNAVAAPQVGVNPLSAWLTGALGLPGVGLTVLLNML